MPPFLKDAFPFIYVLITVLLYELTGGLRDNQSHETGAVALALFTVLEINLLINQPKLLTSLLS